MRTRIPCPTARSAVPMAAVVFPLPGPVFTMMRPRRRSDIEKIRHKAESLIVRGGECPCTLPVGRRGHFATWMLEFDVGISQTTNKKADGFSFRPPRVK